MTLHLHDHQHNELSVEFSATNSAATLTIFGDHTEWMTLSIPQQIRLVAELLGNLYDHFQGNPSGPAADLSPFEAIPNLREAFEQVRKEW